jgi:NSS family neurotransmitter:Na+ symporter
MGGWVAACAILIMFYYSVVAGWCLRYLAASVAGEIRGGGSEAFWNAYTASWQPLGTHAAAMGLAVAVVWFGVRGIERVAKVLIPTLFLLVVVLAVRAVTLPGAAAGLEFLFTPTWSDLAHPGIWIQALTQNAWDTGAGWGLIVAYAVYMKAREDVPLNAFLIGFGNNTVSLLAGIMVLCTVFAINPAAQQEIVGAGNEGLTFIWMPQLFAAMPAGRLFMVIFFLALSFAALTSLISMVELGTRVMVDRGIDRRKAVLGIGAAGLVFGAPSALSVTFLGNQDWVWGVGLMLSGLFFALGARRFGIERLRGEELNAPGSDLRIGRWWSFLIGVLIPVEAVVLILWWLVREAAGGSAAETLNPLTPFGAGTVLVQWAVVLAVLLAANRWLAKTAGEEAP